MTVYWGIKYKVFNNKPMTELSTLEKSVRLMWFPIDLID